MNFLKVSHFDALHLQSFALNKRVLTPAYDDGFNSARSKAVSGNSLPNPRTVCLKVSPPPSKPLLENSISQIYAIFGQLLIHDMSGTSASTDSSGTELDCPCGSTDSNCLPITWPSNDALLNQTCQKFARSSASFPDTNCSLAYREQLNLLSSYIDGSSIYGIDESRANELRTFSDGLLKTSSPVTEKGQTVTDGTYLPLSNDTCSSSDTDYKCFLAGEYRTSENLALVSMHTLFNREHNRIAAILKTQNPTWTDENLYQESRRINIAILQHIVYNEWLTMVVGNSSLAPSQNAEYYNGYDSIINPALSNEFSTAAFRFGHSLIRDKFSRYDSAESQLKPLNFTETVFKSDYAYDVKGQGIHSILKGIIKDNCWKFGTFGLELQNYLFAKIENNTYSATDLLATNIQRGRDHGLQPYTKYVKHCHGIDVKSYDDLKDLLSSTARTILQSVYENVDDIDLYAGGLLEKKISNTTLAAKTFSCLIMEQFADLKNGDRFYYENGPTVNQGAFTLDQLSEIKKITMACLVCNNYGLTTIPKNVFFNPSDTNPNFDCSTLESQVDLSKWTGIF
ncbi:unnamed protein product [Brachionus calyciflorus]|uniref:Uncharacterized protein n=1 Tax=Brachionus calyciflorus TaxID=104777 RepID=A0A813SVT8_9BILA|nr:unnamed protein product [Brachionus calyciflorus]